MLGRIKTGRPLCALALAVIMLQAAGCSHIVKLKWLESDQRMLERIAERTRRLGTLEGRGVMRLQYRGHATDVPFRLRLWHGSALQVDLESTSGIFPGLGRITIVSDDAGTLVYGPRGLVDLAGTGVKQSAVRALVLSLFGGGDPLVAWLGSTGCPLSTVVSCSGLQVDFSLNRERRSVEKWEITDKTDKVSFGGLVYAHDGAGSLPRVVTGVIHPREIAVTVRYSEISLALEGSSPWGAGFRVPPRKPASALGAYDTGNFVADAALDHSSGGR